MKGKWSGERSRALFDPGQYQLPETLFLCLNIVCSLWKMHKNLEESETLFLSTWKGAEMESEGPDTAGNINRSWMKWNKFPRGNPWLRAKGHGWKLMGIDGSDVRKMPDEKRVCDERQKCERLWSEFYKHLKHPTTLSTIKFKDGRNNPL